MLIHERGGILRAATCCGNVNLKYDNEISGSQYPKPASTAERVLDLPWYCYDRWRACREDWSDAPPSARHTLRSAPAVMTREDPASFAGHATRILLYLLTQSDVRGNARSSLGF